jgi:hypothetical protein
MLPEADAAARDPVPDAEGDRDDDAGSPDATSPATSPVQPILDVARRTRYVVGANSKEAAAGATWSFLLPGLPVHRMAVVGAPTAAARVRLGELAHEVVDGLPADGTVDLIWIASSVHAPAPARSTLAARLSTEGLIVDERPDLVASVSTDAIRYRVLRRQGDIVVAIPAGHHAAEAWLRGHGLAGTMPMSLVDRFRRYGSTVRGRTRAAPTTWGSLDLIRPNEPDQRAELDGPVRYLRDLARSAGMDIGDHTMALSATGPYRTQKVLIPLFAPGAVVPDLIAKITRHPSVNPRLQVELDGLRWLATLGPAIAERVPAVRFSGMHADMLVVGETVLEGGRFHARGAADHPLAADAVGWLTELGACTATHIDAREAAAALDDLLDAYIAADGPGRKLGDALRAQVDRIRRSRVPFPVVAQHGDPGTWNLVALPGDRTGILDWENLERRGMPLWDLFYLLRSLGVGNSPRRPLERRLEHVQRTLLDESELSPFIVAAVRRYCSRVGVADDLVEPLYHLGWMYQALKEVTRLRPGHLGEGHFYALLRRGLERRDRGTLQRLFRGNDI